MRCLFNGGVYSRAAFITLATHFASTPNILIASLDGHTLVSEIYLYMSSLHLHPYTVCMHNLVTLISIIAVAFIRGQFLSHARFL